jgi:hypothetical protein
MQLKEASHVNRGHQERGCDEQIKGFHTVPPRLAKSFLLLYHYRRAIAKLSGRTSQSPNYHGDTPIHAHLPSLVTNPRLCALTERSDGGIVIPRSMEVCDAPSSEASPTIRRY